MFIQFARLAPSRHPVLRVLAGVLAVAVLALFSVLGLFIVAALALAFGLRALWRQWRFPHGFPQASASSPSRPLHARAAPTHDPDVIEGEFTVIDARKSERS